MNIPFIIIFCTLLFFFSVGIIGVFPAFLFVDGFCNNFHVMKYLCPEDDKKINTLTENTLMIYIFGFSFLLIFRELCRGAAPHKE